MEKRASMADRRHRDDHGYVEGNTVRREWSVPQHGEEIPGRERPLTEEEYREKKKKEESSRSRAARRRRQEAAWNMDFVSMLYFSAAIFVTMYVCVSYLQVQANITSMSKEVIALENQLINLRNENDAALEKVNASVDLDYIYKVATKKLKMVHAQKSQIILFEGVKDDYVRKYGEIPEMKKETIVDKIFK